MRSCKEEVKENKALIEQQHLRFFPLEAESEISSSFTA